MGRSLSLAACVLITCIATPAHAQQNRSDDSIVVTGQKLPPDKKVRSFVRQIASTVDGQLSRFAEPVCPLAIGLSAEFNSLIKARIRRIAAEADIALGKEGCTPNLILMVAQDADQFVTALRKRFPAMFAALSPSALRRALKEGPVHVWSTVEVRNEDGGRVGGVTDEGVKVLNVRSASRITLPTQYAVLKSVIVIDAEATVGKSLTQIADYTAMRTLAGARPPAEAGASETILALFDREATAPAMLTLLDKGFLRGLYRAQANGRATSQMHTISRTILKDAKRDK